MELARGDDVWIRGVGLNAAGAESRAERIIGPGWRNAVVKGKFLRKNRQGRVQVKLDSGETVWVGPEFLSSEAVEGGEGPEGGLGDVLPDQDLGSDEEREDGQQEEGEVEGSFSNRHSRMEEGWQRTNITQDQRLLDGYIRNFACHMRGVDDAQRASPWG